MHRRSERFEQAGLKIVVVLTEADEQMAETLKRKYALNFPVIPDPTQQIAKRYGIQIWPTLISVDKKGVVGNVILGTHRNALSELGRSATTASE